MVLYKYDMSPPTVLIASIITLLVSGSGKFVFKTTSLEERLQKITKKTMPKTSLGIEQAI